MFVAPPPVRKAFTERVGGLLPKSKQSVNCIALQAELGTVKVTSGVPRPVGAPIVAFNPAFRRTQAEPMTFAPLGVELSSCARSTFVLFGLMICGATVGSGRHELAISGSEIAGQRPKLLVVVNPSLNL